jgi:outer membrane protein
VTAVARLLVPAALALAAVAACAQAAAGGAAAATGVPLALTVDQAVARALATQPQIQQAQASVEAARARVGQAQSAYYPNLAGTGSYSHSEPDQTMDLGPLGTVSLSPQDIWDLHVTLGQVITQFGKRDAQVRLAESGVASARVGVEQARTAIGYQAAQVFLGALYLREQAKVLDAQYGNLEQHLQGIQVREATGSATRLDDLGTQVRMATLRGQRAEVENQYQKQKIALRQLIGLAPSDDIVLNGGFEQGAVETDAAAVVASALQRRTEVRQALEGEGAAQLNKRLAVDAALPTLSARATIGYRNGIAPTPDELTFNWVGAVQVSVPIFQGLLTARQIDEAQKKVEAAGGAARAARLSVTTQALQAAQDLLAARQQVTIAAAGLEQARQMVEVAKLQYDIGIVSNLEYLDAQNALQSANLASLTARYKQVLAEYALRQAAGEPPAE